ncbi:MAG TPA: c-type cytochrome [Pseudolabrys sp.]|nr:c-type cytochrome [Pseudolabrys sp.]
MIRASALGFAIGALMIGGANAQSDLVKRGDYLVNTIMTCGNCHSPKGPSGDIPGKHFSGGLSWDEPPFKVTAPNITQDKETGIGKWSDADIKKLIRTGVRPNGVPIATVMPTGFYEILSDRDLNAIVAYLRTIKPIRNTVPAPIYKMPQVREIFPGAEKPLPASAMKNKIKRGFYLATIGHCMECHTPMEKGERLFKTRLGAGGFEFPGPWGVSMSRNITSSKSKGIGTWTDAEIKRAITTGVDKDGNHLKPPMGFGYYAHMTNADLDDVIAWVRTLPPKE